METNSQNHEFQPRCRRENQGGDICPLLHGVSYPPVPPTSPGTSSHGGSRKEVCWRISNTSLPCGRRPPPAEAWGTGTLPRAGRGGGGTHRCDNLDPWPGGLTHSRYTRTGAPQHPSSAILRDRLLPGPPTPARGEGMSQRHRLEMSQPHDQFSEKFYLLPTA